MTKLLAEAVLVQLTLHSGQNLFPKVEFLISKGAKRKRKKRRKRKKKIGRKEKRKKERYLPTVNHRIVTRWFFLLFSYNSRHRAACVVGRITIQT